LVVESEGGGIGFEGLRRVEKVWWFITENEDIQRKSEFPGMFRAHLRLMITCLQNYPFALLGGFLGSGWLSGDQTL
jgi:hypothetical protein